MAAINKYTDSKGLTSYRVRVRLKGQPVQSATFKRLTDAKKWAQQTEAAIREGRYFNKSVSQKRTLSELIDRYIERVMPQKKVSTQVPQKSQLEWWKGEIGALSLASVDSSRIADCRDKLTDEGRSPATANRYMAVLSHCMSYAQRDLQWIERNPCHDVRKGKESRGVVRFLSNDEIGEDGKVLVKGERTRLLEVCKASTCKLLYPAVLLAMSTGMRRGEQFSLTWRQVDTHTGRILLEDTKNGERRVVVATGPALAELKGMAKVRRIDCDLVFPGQRNTAIHLNKPWYAALKAAEIEDFRWHDLRHSFASELAMSGATLAEIAEAMGHKTLNMVKRYAHLTEGHISSVVERMTSRVFGGDS
ncbi:putative prophage phiRv2 integrase [Mariprofundus micogutta]|uniref:Putative prophage phiRv2 integrase n=1 Tax=Mariprofundus micogutta TaxID=1921010 RepID=A0A1L8CPP5_9PROT|nr:site-specific integrase [Mariprofundus micogutta]GAV20891.1 putative prophage phiRv2 integrase [Mariprofundus micogutta]